MGEKAFNLGGCPPASQPGLPLPSTSASKRVTPCQTKRAFGPFPPISQHPVDVPPTLESYTPRPWEQAHRPNLTGTYEAYRPPGSTLRPGAVKPPLDYEPWQPK